MGLLYTYRELRNRSKGPHRLRRAPVILLSQLMKNKKWAHWPCAKVIQLGPSWVETSLQKQDHRRREYML